MVCCCYLFCGACAALAPDCRLASTEITINGRPNDENTAEEMRQLSNNLSFCCYVDIDQLCVTSQSMYVDRERHTHYCSAMGIVRDSEHMLNDSIRISNASRHHTNCTWLDYTLYQTTDCRRNNRPRYFLYAHRLAWQSRWQPLFIIIFILITECLL